MVRPGFKFEIACFSAAVIAEMLKLAGRNQNGATYVYEVMRPKLRDIISRITEEEYQEMMRMVNTSWGRFTTWMTDHLEWLWRPLRGVDDVPVG